MKTLMQIFRKACLGLLRLCGWRTSFAPFPEPHGLIIVYPHTSNWDFPLGVLFKLGHNLPARWMGKDQMFRWPFRRLLLAIGGVPINRRENTGFVASMVDTMRKEDGFWLAVAPEGTRAYTEYLKSGFYQLALAADVPIGLGYVDYGRRQVGIDRYVRMTGDEERDLQVLRDFYSTIQPKKPANVGGLRFRDRRVLRGITNGPRFADGRTMFVPGTRVGRSEHRQRVARAGTHRRTECESLCLRAAPADHRLPGPPSALSLDAPLAAQSRRSQCRAHAGLARGYVAGGLSPATGQTIDG